MGRFQYTGQAWIGELGMYHYKARIYSPNLGRFLQTDPIGYDDQVNLYAYVGSDPVNGVDPSGLCAWDACVAEGTVATGTVIGLGVAVACYASGACETIAEATVKGAEKAADFIEGVFSDNSPDLPPITTPPAVTPTPQGPTTNEAKGNRNRSGQTRGEKGRAARPEGTPDAGKHKNPGKGYRTDPQTGKKIPLPPPPKPKPPEPEIIPKGKKKDES